MGLRPVRCRHVIILVMNKSDFVITRIITDRIALHSFLLPLLTQDSGDVSTHLFVRANAHHNPTQTLNLTQGRVGAFPETWDDRWLSAGLGRRNYKTTLRKTPSGRMLYLPRLKPPNRSPKSSTKYNGQKIVWSPDSELERARRRWWHWGCPLHTGTGAREPHVAHSDRGLRHPQVHFHSGNSTEDDLRAPDQGQQRGSRRPVGQCYGRFWSL